MALIAILEYNFNNILVSERTFPMDKLQKQLIASIAEDHNIAAKTLTDILKTANDFSYNKTTPGQRTNEYYGLIKFAVNNESK